ncbi:unnamed protein product [Arctogadus glacialis]
MGLYVNHTTKPYGGLRTEALGGWGPSRRTAPSLGTLGWGPSRARPPSLGTGPSLGPHRPDPIGAVDQEHTEPGRVRRPCRESTFRSHRSVCHAISEPRKENGGPSARHRHDGGPGHGRLHGVLVRQSICKALHARCMMQISNIGSHGTGNRKQEATEPETGNRKPHKY